VKKMEFFNEVTREEKKVGRPKEYLTNEERNPQSIRLTRAQKKNIKNIYGNVQRFIETAYLQLVAPRVRSSSSDEENR